MKKISLLSSLLFLAAPLIASAQQLTPIKNLVASIGSIVFLLIPILIGVAIIFFFWGLIQYIRAAGGKGHDAGLKTMVAGLVSIFIMVTLYGIISFASSALGINGNNGALQPPTVGGLHG